jgi:hypothetical protein
MKEREMISPSNNDLPTPTNDDIVNPKNPVNPDSKTTRYCAQDLVVPTFYLILKIL